MYSSFTVSKLETFCYEFEGIEGNKIFFLKHDILSISVDLQEDVHDEKAFGMVKRSVF